MKSRRPACGSIGLKRLDTDPMMVPFEKALAHVRRFAPSGAHGRFPLRAAGLLAIGLPLLSGCQSDLLPAVFGLGNGGVSSYAPGTLPVVEAHPGDRLIGQSGTETGRCIFENRAGNRFRSACPPDFSL